MLSDQQLIELTINEPSWEDAIAEIVTRERMDPWNIDLIKLADTFLAYLQKMETLDLRIPARFILIAAVLLRMKSDIFAQKHERRFIPETDEKESELLRALAAVPPLQPPLKRIPLANVTINELILALRKAFDVRERREIKKKKIRAVVEHAVPRMEEDITEKINNLLAYIENTLQALDSIEFSRLVKHWERKEIVRTFIPLLHLSQDGKITLKQNELFKEIFVEKRKHEKG